MTITRSRVKTQKAVKRTKKKKDHAIQSVNGHDSNASAREDDPNASAREDDPNDGVPLGTKDLKDFKTNFAKYTTCHSYILDLGCGTGRLTKIIR